MYNEPTNGDPIGRVNRLLLAWPTDDNLPGDGYESVRSTYKKLTAGLNEIKATAERDAEYAMGHCVFSAYSCYPKCYRQSDRAARCTHRTPQGTRTCPTTRRENNTSWMWPVLTWIFREA